MTISSQYGFLAGKDFRSFLEFTLTGGQELIIKAVVPINVILKSVDTLVVEGNIRLETLVGGVEGGTFSVALPIFNRNNMTTRPFPLYTSQVTLVSGGTHTGGALLDVHINKTAISANAVSTVGTMFNDERGIAPNTYYFHVVSTGASTGVFKIRWEELP